MREPCCCLVVQRAVHDTWAIKPVSYKEQCSGTCLWMTAFQTEVTDIVHRRGRPRRHADARLARLHPQTAQPYTNPSTVRSLRLERKRKP